MNVENGTGKRVTMATVGRMAGVSQVTVSRALSDPSKVSPETLRRIREAIELTGFVPNAIAGALASNRSNLVTALIPSLTNVVYSSFMAPFSETLRARGYQILLSETGFDPSEEEALISAHLSRRPDAMLLTGIQHTAATRRLLLGAAIPVVEVWDLSDSPVDLCVGFSHAEAGRAVADFALDLGHSCAASVTASDERAHRRRRAFADRFSARGGASVRDVDVGGPASIRAGRTALAGLIEGQGPTPRLVFCSSDLLAHGVMIEAQARGLSIPEDLAVIGFGDQDFAAELEPALTSVRVDRKRLGRLAAEALLARLAKSEVTHPVVDVGFEIVRRGTT
ncbi:HTH-type transcriptional regulator GntR [Roseivivax jejudonensis]|uniref:HTH-type transcriptional regulator GntR n=1 Tax=Roseivivax jejudonensis TaxID=1529041 RepID=A0A1X6Y7A1_9RHOB|nr:LacI family DNA-binding transcriptional regulator [Roseivivax jejudonensis]SLN12789.1 HTH-type transcriptional regulator GntR [Roseivivax jejudonensis]